jgi:glycosyltransferase involved in cell wall biosynthesis
MGTIRGKILLVTNWDWVMYNFRMPLARALREHGGDVVLVFPFGKFLEKIEKEGFRCVHWPLDRGSMNLLRDLPAIWRLARIYRQECPQIVHHFTLKPNLYGSLVARWVSVRHGQGLRCPVVINTFTGLGFLFSGSSRARVLQKAIMPLLRYSLRMPDVWTVFYNQADMDFFLHRGLVPALRVAVIAGSGVDLRRFSPDGHIRPPAEAPVTVLMACRLLWDKGVGEFVEAARELHRKGLPVRFRLAGDRDPANPACIPERLLQEWHQEGLIEWLGHRDDMPDLLRRTDVAVLPSYHEGAPKFLLEAAACGLPLVATEIEGCRRIVRHGENGLLVPPGDARALAEALELLVRDPAMRHRMGRASRALAAQEFDEKKVVGRWLDFYENVLSDGNRNGGK